jgi:prevent-host-death family protein
MAWQLQDAKQRFSELVRRALDEGPQTVTRHGQDVVVVLSAAAYRALSETKPDLKDFLLSSPDLGPLELDRLDRDLPRTVDLGV